MAVENKYVDPDLAAGKLGYSAFVSGDKDTSLIFNFEVAAADDDGSIYRIAKGLNPNLIVKSVKIFNDAITLGTDYDLGIARINGDVLGTGDQLAAALDMSAAAGIATPKNGLTNVAIEDIQKRLYELAGQTVLNKSEGFDLVITANTVGTAAGTISGVIEFVQG